MYRSNENPPLFRWKIFNEYSKIINIGITTRTGGISSSPFCNFNQALHCGDKGENVVENRRILCRSQSISFDSYTCAEQTHNANIRIISPNDRGSGNRDYGKAIKNTDALIITERDVMINIHLADCVPVVLFDSQKKTGALIHAGWKGTAKLIAYNTAEYMIKRLHCSPENLIAGIGPSIGSCCFRIKEDTASELRNSFPYSENVISGTSQSIRADLKQANREQLIQCGLSPENIETSDICTSCHNDEFYSYRADEGTTGRFSVFMSII